MQSLQRSKRPAPASTPATRQVTAPLGSDELVTLVAVSLRVGTASVRTAALTTALDAAFTGTTPGPRIVLLPGWTAGWPLSDSVVVDVCRRHSAAVRFERAQVGTGFWTSYDANGDTNGRRIHQWITDSGQADRQPDRVRDILRRSAPGGEGTIHLAGVDVGLLCCGENNILRCEQSHENRVSVRHDPQASLFDHVAVVLNGAHTRMGNWGKLTKRFEYLSRGRRLALFITNNLARAAGQPGTSWRGAVRAYFNGALLADGGGVLGAQRDVDVRVVADDAHDQACALVVRAKGSLLKAR
ncbi:hypothetical protein LBMAG42_03620 [Deltaproteobacteria bacterium]|nr:hypothetical protein LBMAG42_03620 [Deltaproteobacteria bacterium]